MAGVTVRITGAKEIERMLRALPARIAGKIVRPALRAAAKEIQTEAKRLAPFKSGLLRKNIKVRAGKRKRGRISVLVQNKAGDYRGETYYAAFQEFGYRIGSRKLGTSRKEVAGKGFMRRAGESKQKAATEIVSRMMREGVIREAKK